MITPVLNFEMECPNGFEPSKAAWKVAVLPLHYGHGDDRMGVAARGMERCLPNDIPFTTKGNKQAEVMRMFMKLQEKWNKLPAVVRW